MSLHAALTRVRTEEDVKDAYIEATAPVYDAYAKQFPDLVEALKSAAGH